MSESNSQATTVKNRLNMLILIKEKGIERNKSELNGLR